MNKIERLLHLFEKVQNQIPDLSCCRPTSKASVSVEDGDEDKQLRYWEWNKRDTTVHYVSGNEYFLKLKLCEKVRLEPICIMSKWLTMPLNECRNNTAWPYRSVRWLPWAPTCKVQSCGTLWLTVQLNTLTLVWKASTLINKHKMRVINWNKGKTNRKEKIEETK